jgi:molecular chaperone GrpE
VTISIICASAFRNGATCPIRDRNRCDLVHRRADIPVCHLEEPTRMSDQSQTPATENAPEGANGNDMNKELEAARAEVADLKDKYLRLRAEMDNFRKMQEKRAQDRIKQEKKNMLMRVIESIDDVERALAYQEVADRDALLGALKHVHGQLSAMLQREGVVSFTTQGEAFDPHVHEAVERVDDSGKPEGEIVQEMQKGYLYGDELLRPARVHVSSGESAEQSR